MWVLDWKGEKAYAYTLGNSGAVYEPALDIILDDENGTPAGIWSDGSDVWVVDNVDRYVYGYAMLGRNPVTVSRTTNVPTVGAQLSAALDDPGGGVTGLSWQWSRSSNGTSFTDIAGATAPSYIPASRDVGRYLRVMASYTDADHAARTAEGLMDCPVVRALRGPGGARRSIQLHCDNANPSAIWSDGATIWVADTIDHKVYAYTLPGTGDDYDSGATHDPRRDFALADENGSPSDMWSDGVTLWVTDWNDDKLYAYLLSNSGTTYDAAGDVPLPEENHDPRGIWSDGTTMWVADDFYNRVYAYTLTNSGADRDSTRDFALVTDNRDGADMWSDGTTLWVADRDGSLYAYTLTDSGAIHNPTLDLAPADGNVVLDGIWSDGTDVWVVDPTAKYVHAYGLPTEAPGSVTVSGSTNVPTVGLQMSAALDDPDGGVTGLSWQWARSSNGTSFTDIAGATAAAYTPRAADVGKYLRVKARYDSEGGVGRTAERVTDCPVVAALGSLEGIKRSIQLHCDNRDALGLWSDGATLWVTDTSDRKVYAYRFPDPGAAHDSGVTYQPAGDFSLADENTGAGDMWSDGATLWVTDSNDAKLYAYTMSGAGVIYDPGNDITLADDNDDPQGVWSDGAILWVSDSADDKVYAYTLGSAGATYNPTRDFDLTGANRRPRRIWSDGTTMWVLDPADDKLYAYTLTDTGATYDSTMDIALVRSAEQGGIWSDGTDMWVADYTAGYVHAYDLPTEAPGSVIVSGSTNVPTVGSPLAGAVNDPDGGVTGVSWQWARSLNGTTFTDITGATASAYTPGAADVGRYLRVKAGYTDTHASGRTAESVTDCPAVAAPETFEVVKRSIQLHCDNSAPSGMWSDGTTLWVSNLIGSRVYAYALTGSGVTYDSGMDIELASGNRDARDLWSDGTTMWVLDSGDDKLYAYTLGGSGATYDSAKDIDLDDRNGSPRGVWSDGVTMWVSDDQDDKVYAYTLTVAGADLDRTRDFAPASDNRSPTGLWSDGATMWVSDSVDDKLYAYTLTTTGATYDSTLDIALVDGSAPGGIWSGGPDIWVLDYSTKYAHAYDLDQPGYITVSKPTNVPTVGSRIAATLDDPDGGVTGVSWQWSRSSNGRTFTDIAGATASSYTPSAEDVDGYLRVTAGYDDAEAASRTAARVMDCPVVAPLEVAGVNGNIQLHCDNGRVGGIWSDGTTLWVLDRDDHKVYAYSFGDSGVTYNPIKNFDLAGDNVNSVDIWSDGTTLWVVDWIDAKLYAYTLTRSGATHDPTRDITLSRQNLHASGLWGVGETLYVADSMDDKVYVYTLTGAGATHDFDRDFGLAAGNDSVGGMWSDGTTLWVSDWTDDKLYAYTLTSPISGVGVGATYNPKLDRSLVDANASPLGIWSDGTDMWVADTEDLYLYAYALPGSGPVAVSRSTNVPTVGSAMSAVLTDPDRGAATPTWQWARLSNGPTFTDIAGATASSYTPSTEDVDTYLRVTATYEDLASTGRTAERVTDCPVAAAPAVSRVSIQLHCDNSRAAGIWSDGTTLWVSDQDDRKMYAYIVGDPGVTYDSGVTYDPTEDFDLAAGNQNPGDHWSDGTTLWVVDEVDRKLYAYTLTGSGTGSGATYDSTQDITLNAHNTQPVGVWGIGETLFVSDSFGDKVYAYTLTGAGVTDDPARGFDLATGNDSPGDLWSDGTTMWVMDWSGDKVYAYTLTGAGATYDPTRDITLVDGNAAPVGIWSDGTEMWVADTVDQYVYAYDLADSSLVFASGSFTFTVAENAAAGSLVGVTDAGEGTVSYGLSGIGAGSFSIDGNGRITVVSGSSLDFETTPSYTLTVTATDSLDATDTATVNIGVANVDEDGTVTFSSSQPRVDAALTATLSDPDGATGSVSWVWAKSSDDGNSWTDINGATTAGYTPVAADLDALLRATASYTDPEGSGKSAIGQAANAVQSASVSNTAPVFAADVATRSVAENAAAGTDGGSRVVATDQDTDDTVSYGLSGTGAFLFAIDGNGQITVRSSGTLDYETAPSFTLTVTATDTSNASDTITVIIGVNNVDEDGTVTFSSSQPRVGAALTAILSDPDGATSSVSWVWAKSSDSGGSWTDIAGSTSESYTPLAGDAGALLRATASYTDPEGSGKTAGMVAAAPVSNPAPVFASDSYMLDVAENAAGGALVGSPVTATDADDDTIIYGLSGTGAFLFAIDGNGQITVRRSGTLDYETAPSFTLTVTAMDTSNGSDMASVDIEVTNVDEPGTVAFSSPQPQVDAVLTATISRSGRVHRFPDLGVGQVVRRRQQLDGYQRRELGRLHAGHRRRGRSAAGHGVL